MLSWSEISGPSSNAVPQCVVSLQAGDHIHANEVILTFGMSNTTLLFLKEAAKKRDFQVGFQTATSVMDSMPLLHVQGVVVGVLFSVGRKITTH